MDLLQIDFVLEMMVWIGMFLLIYGEVMDSEIDIFDWEVVFIECYLVLLWDCYFELKVVFEYIIIE